MDVSAGCSAVCIAHPTSADLRRAPPATVRWPRASSTWKWDRRLLENMRPSQADAVEVSVQLLLTAAHLDVVWVSAIQAAMEDRAEVVRTLWPGITVSQGTAIRERGQRGRRSRTDRAGFSSIQGTRLPAGEAPAKVIVRLTLQSQK